MPMKVILLLAGRSRRFWPLREKSLFPIAGKTLLEHQVATLKEAGFKDILLVGGEHNLREIKKMHPKLSTVKQKDLDLGMQGALLSALPKLKDEPVLIVSGNDVVDAAAYRSLLAASKGNRGAILAKKVKRYFPGGYIKTKGGRALAIIEKPGEGKEPSDLVNIVAHIHPSTKRLLSALKGIRKANDDGYEQALTTLMKDDEYRTVPYAGFWQPVKYPWHLLTLLPHFLAAYAPKQVISKKASIHKTAVIEGVVVIEDGVHVLPHATIVGPVFIGKRTIIGNNALVRGSSVGEDCVIGYNTEVKSSVVSSHVWTHMSYVGDSVIGDNVAFGGGSMTGNFRLDEGEVLSIIDGKKIPTGTAKLGAIIGDNVRLGIQVVMNPGIKIGAGTFVAGGATVSGDLPDGSFVTMKAGEIQIKENRSYPHDAKNREKYRSKLL